jgi:peptide/nickel transport system ATP-binding protein/oligopeptide transport system ATP-binding protein
MVDASLLSIQDLHVVFPTYAGNVYAVNGMSFDVRQGEVFGLVGESGCGKSVTSLAVLHILPGRGSITSGRILFDGKDLVQASEAELQAVRGRQISMIFQDPSTSLNPVFTAGNQILRILRHHKGLSTEDARRRALELFEEVALPEPRRVFRSYPHELSGGMQQRVMIAMALASGARLLIADEPTTALDVTIQDQILQLLVALRRKEGLSILLITHNLGVVAETCDRVGVAYAGKIVESGPTEVVLRQPRHPYTQGLLAALPEAGQRGRDLLSIRGSVPEGLELIPGCPFHLRCPHVMEMCRQTPPALLPVDRSEQWVACYLDAAVAAQ